MDQKNVIIIGSGPAGYSAAIYAARANLAPILFEGFMSGPAGGQLMTTTDVENYPGFPEGILGPKMMESFKKQAVRFGTKIFTEDVQQVDLSTSPYFVKGSKNSFQTHSIIIATGAMAKRLDIEGTREGEFWQRGVSACAICDGAAPIFKEKNLFVIGGGDSAVEEAIFLTKYAKKVFIVHRRDALRASKIMAERAQSHPKIEILWNKVLVKVYGDKVVEGVTLQDTQSKELQQLESGGVFFAIGHQPNTSFLANQITLDPKGYIIVEKGTSRTNVEGVFAAGDVQDPIYRQAVTAAGSGCMAALDAERWLSAKGLIL